MTDSISFGHVTYLSPFTWRYGSVAMRELWSETHKRRLWRRVWLHWHGTKRFRTGDGSKCPTCAPTWTR